jgi:hypothetical protein
MCNQRRQANHRCPTHSCISYRCPGARSYSFDDAFMRRALAKEAPIRITEGQASLRQFRISEFISGVHYRIRSGGEGMVESQEPVLSLRRRSLLLRCIII